MAEIETVVTILEMQAAPRRRVPPPAGERLALMRASPVPLHFYRYLYTVIGRTHYWVDRLRMGEEALSELLSNERNELTVLYAGGVPAGYFELDVGVPGLVTITYLGLVPEFIGRGLGRVLLSAALDAAWAKTPRTVRVQTCTLDHPAALPLYQKFGFSPVSQRTHRFALRPGEAP